MCFGSLRLFPAMTWLLTDSHSTAGLRSRVSSSKLASGQWMNSRVNRIPAAPRLAAAWSPKWAGGARFSAGWGIFYDAITSMVVSARSRPALAFYGPTGGRLACSSTNILCSARGSPAAIRHYELRRRAQAPVGRLWQDESDFAGGQPWFHVRRHGRDPFAEPVCFDNIRKRQHCLLFV